MQKKIQKIQGVEICDGEDNDEDGQIDENLIGPRASKTKGVCSGQKKICDGQNGWKDPDFTAISGFEISESLCDHKDNDCDGRVDEGGIKTLFYVDRDGDGYGGHKRRKFCSSSGKNKATKGGDCNDNVKSIHPGAKEMCDRVDNNCNRKIDEGEVCKPSFICRNYRYGSGIYSYVYKKHGGQFKLHRYCGTAKTCNGRTGNCDLKRSRYSCKKFFWGGVYLYKNGKHQKYCGRGGSCDIKRGRCR